MWIKIDGGKWKVKIKSTCGIKILPPHVLDCNLYNIGRCREKLLLNKKNAILFKFSRMYWLYVFVYLYVCVPVFVYLCSEENNGGYTEQGCAWETRPAAPIQTSTADDHQGHIIILQEHHHWMKHNALQYYCNIISISGTWHITSRVISFVCGFSQSPNFITKNVKCSVRSLTGKKVRQRGQWRRLN